MNKINDDEEMIKSRSNSDKLDKYVQEGNEIPSRTAEQEAFDDSMVDALNVKILEITQTIKAKFPELSKFLDEIPIATPDNDDPVVSFEGLREYYLSLEAILKKYRQENPDR